MSERNFLRKIIIFPLILVFIFISVTCNSFAAFETGDDIKVKSKASVVMNANGKALLYDKEANKKMYPASTTKVLTALIVLENVENLDEEVTVSKNAVFGIEAGSSHIALKPGEKISVRNLLYALLLASANDAAVALAEHVGGSVKGFADMMNAEAEEMGLTGSHFVNPHGLYNKDHYTTAYDLAVITSEACKQEEFLKIISSPKHTIPKTNKTKKKRPLWNKHRMTKNQYAYDEDVVGGKDGYIEKSKCNLITIANTNDMTLVFVTMRCKSFDICVKDTEKLLKYYRNNYYGINLDVDLNKVSTDKIKDIDVYTEDSVLQATVKKSVPKEDVKTEVSLLDNIELPIQENQVLGVLQAKYGDDVLGTTPIHSVKKVSKSHKIIVDIILILITILLLRMFYRMYRNAQRKKRRRQRREAERRARARGY